MRLIPRSAEGATDEQFRPFRARVSNAPKPGAPLRLPLAIIFRAFSTQNKPGILPSQILSLI